MNEKDPPLPSGKELPPSLDMKIWDLEAEIKSLKETGILKDEEKIFDEIISQYGALDETMQKEVLSFKLLVNSNVAEGIDTIAAIDGAGHLKISENHQNVFITLTPPAGKAYGKTDYHSRRR